MKNKIVIFIGNLQSGGAERVVSEISSMYADHFLKVIILTFYNAPVFYQIDDRVSIECIQNNTATTNTLKNALWLRRFIKREKPDVFLSFLMPYNMFALFSLLFTKVKIVVCERQDPSNIKTAFLRSVRNILYHFCRRIEVQTSNGKAYFSKNLQKKIFVIPNPNHITIQERDLALATKKTERAAIVGRLTPEKNHKMLINAIADVHKKHPAFGLDIYGDGVLQDAINKQIEALGLSDIIILHGKTNNVPACLAPAMMFLLTSDVEGMPNALMEAMALGVPCISTDVSGVRDIIEDGENGFIVPVGDKNALVEKIEILIASDSLRKHFSEASSAILERFDKQIIFQQWLDLVTFE